MLIVAALLLIAPEIYSSLIGGVLIIPILIRHLHRVARRRGSGDGVTARATFTSGASGHGCPRSNGQARTH